MQHRRDPRCAGPEAGRAVTSIAECPTAVFADEYHRLRGTIATYELTDAAELIGVLESTAREQREDPTAVEVMRSLGASSPETMAQSPELTP